jgi:hypothetical protein
MSGFHVSILNLPSINSLATFTFYNPFSYNVVAEFIKKGYTDGFVQQENKHVYVLLNFRYTRALEDTIGTTALISDPKIRFAESLVDRAVWPKGFVAAVDEEDRVKFN